MPQKLSETEPPLTPQRKLLPSAGGGWQEPAAPPPLPQGTAAKPEGHRKTQPRPQPCGAGPSHRNWQAVVRKGLFPAHMETRGPHVASVVFPRRGGAKAGRPDFQTSLQSSRPEPSQAFPSQGPQLPSGLSSTFGLSFCRPSPCCQPTAPSPSGFGQGLGSSEFGFQQWCAGCPQALGTLEQASES